MPEFVIEIFHFGFSGDQAGGIESVKQRLAKVAVPKLFIVAVHRHELRVCLGVIVSWLKKIYAPKRVTIRRLVVS